MHYKTYSDLSNDIKRKLPVLINEDFDLVVGIPRSGMIPAYMIAFNLNINCISIESLYNNALINHGITRTPNRIVKYPWEAKKILLVDDSIKSGNSMAKVLEKIPDHLKSKITTLAVYTGQGGAKKVDIFIEYLPWPRMFEWNILYHTALPYYCMGIDGVLCEEVKSDNNLKESEYRNNLVNAKPLIIPNTKIHSLVTNREEKYRDETESWLRKNNVQYEHLIMLTSNGSLKNSKIDAGIKHKAAYYKNSDTILFVEKDPFQAISISKLTLKPVFCFSNNQMYMPDQLDMFKKDPTYLFKAAKNVLKNLRNFLRGDHKTKSVQIELYPKPVVGIDKTA